MSNKTEEALRREVRDAFFNPTLGLHRSVDILDHPNVRAAFDAYDKAVIAANKPTFEGDEAPMINEQEVRHLLRSSGTELDRQALALLDAKDAEISEWRKLETATADARDAALSRAEQAEAALAERDAAIAEVVRWLERAPLESGICCCGDPIEGHGYYNGHSPVDGLAYSARQLADTLRPFLPAKPAKPAVDPLKDVLNEAIKNCPSGGKLHEALRAAIERAGGVKAVFGEELE